MKKKPFVQPEKYGILIPYSDFVKIVEMASRVEEMESQYDQLVQMYSALKMQFGDVLDKIAYLDDIIKD